HHAIERRQRLLKLQPRQAAPPRRIDALRAFDHQPLVATRAGGFKRAFDLLDCVRRRDSRQTKRARKRPERLERLSTDLQPLVQKGSSVTPEQIEGNEPHGNLLPEEQVAFPPPQPPL